MRAIFEPDQSDLLNGVYRFFKEKKVISKEKTGVTFKKSFNTNPCLFLGTKTLGIESCGATESEKGTWMLIKLPKPLFITHYSIATYNNNYFRNWKIEGSNSKVSWCTVDDYSQKENNTISLLLKLL